MSNASFAIILMWKRELIGLLCLPSWCLLIVVWLFLAVLQVCLQFVIGVFPDHTDNIVLCCDSQYCVPCILNDKFTPLLCKLSKIYIKRILF